MTAHRRSLVLAFRTHFVNDIEIRAPTQYAPPRIPQEASARGIGHDRGGEPSLTSRPRIRRPRVRPRISCVTRGRIRIGCSGYDYPAWRGTFYPGDLDRFTFFARYAEHFDTVEINNTFYNLPEPETFETWRTQAAEGFEYAVKMSRYGTHMKKLKEPENWIGTFLERADILGERVLEKAIEKGARPHRMPRTWLLPNRDAGSPCPRCGGTIKEEQISGRVTRYCPNCQAPGG